MLTPSINGAVLTFAEYPDQSIDLAEMQGLEPRTIRIYTDEAGEVLSVNDEGGHWLVAEVGIPGKRWEALEDEQQAAVPLAGDDIDITLWKLRGEE